MTTALFNLLSTSQKVETEPLYRAGEVSKELTDEIEFQIEQSKALEAAVCENHAPFIFFVDNTGTARVVQGCCNSWTCPRCGHIRAREEYGRIVEGCRKLFDEGNRLYFWTITCRGKECSLEEAERDYLLWTNRLLSSTRAKSKAEGTAWFYVQVTERQKRLHPHSHLIASFAPLDSIPFARGERLPNGREASHDCLWSKWFREANVKAGLGVECDLSDIRNPIAVAVYVSKYLFKDAMTTDWPAGWRRIRYSRNFPKLPERKPEIAFPLVRHVDWLRMEALDLTVHADSHYTYEVALAHLAVHVIPPKKGN